MAAPSRGGGRRSSFGVEEPARRLRPGPLADAGRALTLETPQAMPDLMSEGQPKRRLDARALAFAPLAALVVGGALSHFVPGCSAEDTTEPTGDDEPGITEGMYTSSGTCDGLPKLKLETPPGVCVGVVATGFKFSRSLGQLPNGDIVVTDMGGWAKDRGTVWLLKRNADKTYSKRQMLQAIDKPSGLAIGPDGLPYVATPTDIFRFDPADRSGAQPRLTVVAKNLGTRADARHPLHHIAFDPKNPWQLYVNVGSDSDNCEVNGTFPMPCDETERAQNARGTILRVDLTGANNVERARFVVARGLRNSMALAFHSTGTLLQGENSRDSINKRAPQLADTEGELPHEELNVVTQGKHYGWPYCYDNGVPSPEYPNANCANYQNPALLLPGHSSPLGMEYYTGTLFPQAYQGNLVVSLHGYREYGHRIVLVPVDGRGVPAGEIKDIVRGWEKTATDPQGAPVDVMVAKDGSIFVAEDKNGTVLRIFYDRAAGNGAPLATKPPSRPVVSPEEAARCQALRTKSTAMAAVERDVIDQACVSCHGAGPGYPGGLALLRCDDVGNQKRLTEARRTAGPLVVPGDERSELVRRLKGDGFPQMPAGGVSPEQLEEVTAWIRAGARAN